MKAIVNVMHAVKRLGMLSITMKAINKLLRLWLYSTNYNNNRRIINPKIKIAKLKNTSRDPTTFMVHNNRLVVLVNVKTKGKLVKGVK
jgi:hypothetical protein